MRTKGWKRVFSFTLAQHVKSKSFIGSTIAICVIVALICVLTNLLPGMINGMGVKETSEGVENGGDTNGFEDFLKQGTVYLYDEAGALNADDKSELEKIFAGGFSEPSEELDDKIDEISGAGNLAAVVRITEHKDKDGNVYEYEVRSYYSKSAKNHVDVLGMIIQDSVRRRIMLNAGVKPENYDDTKVSVAVMKTQAGTEGISSAQGMINTMIPTVLSVVLFLLIFMYGTAVAQSIATEKTSRVMELLLTSVRPLAIVIGKVLAMGVVCILQFILIIAVAVGSFAVSAPFGWLAPAIDLLKDPEIQEAITNSVMPATVSGVSTNDFDLAKALGSVTEMFTPANILILIFVLMLGFLFYALIAALIGASISRMEDLSAAMSPYSMIGVLGFYLSFVPSMLSVDSIETGESKANPVQLFATFFPVSSPFSLPSALLMKTYSPAVTFGAIAMLAASIIIITIIVARVYEAIILYTGNRIKFGAIIKMSAKKQ